MFEDEFVFVVLGGKDVQSLITRAWELRVVVEESQDTLVVVEDRQVENSPGK
jgi:hypothetical protein